MGNRVRQQQAQLAQQQAQQAQRQQQQALAQQNANFPSQLDQWHRQNMAQIQEQMRQNNIATANFMGTPVNQAIAGQQSMEEFMANLNRSHNASMNQIRRNFP